MKQRVKTSGVTTRGLVALVAVVAAVGIVMMVWLSASPQTPKTSVDVTGRYRLLDADGRLFDRVSLRGHPAVVYFGYTNCPDMCPAMLSRLVQARKTLGNRAADLRIVFITIDPVRDTPERLTRFANSLGGNIIALTGSAEVIDTVADQAGVYVMRTKAFDGSDTIEHTMSAFLYDRDNFFVDAIAPNESNPVLLRKLQTIIAPKGPVAAIPASAIPAEADKAAHQPGR